MTVQDAVHTATVPRQGEPTDAPLDGAPLSASAPVPVAIPLLGRDRPLTADERQFALALAALSVVLGTIIVTGLLLAQYAWA